VSDLLSLVSTLKSDVERLSARIDDFERRQSAAHTEADLPIIGMVSIAHAIGLKGPKTLRNWARDIDLAERHKLALLLKRTPSRRWMTTRRLIANWQRATTANPWEAGTR